MIFLHTSDQEKRKSIVALCKFLDIEVINIGYNDLNRTLGDLIEGKGASGSVISEGKDDVAPALYQFPELIIFSGFDNDSLDEFLKCYRDQKIEKISLKAMVTPYNIAWSIYRLTEHLKEEHEYWTGKTQ